MITNILTRSLNHDYKWLCDKKPDWFTKFYDECNSNVAPVLALVCDDEKCLFLITISSATRKDVKNRSIRWQIGFEFKSDSPELKKIPDLILKWLDDYFLQKQHKPNQISEIVDSFDEKMINSALGNTGEEEWFKEKQKSLFEKIFDADFEQSDEVFDREGSHFFGAIKNIQSKNEFVGFVKKLCLEKKNGVALVCSVGIEEKLVEKTKAYENSFFLMNNCDKIESLISNGTKILKKKKQINPLMIKAGGMIVLILIVVVSIIGLVISCQKDENSITKLSIIKTEKINNNTNLVNNVTNVVNNFNSK